MTVYIDTSGGKSEVAVSPAALVATPEAWEEFDKRWSSCLSAYGVTALHMKDFAHFRGEFESWKFHTLKRRKFLNHLLWIIEDLVEWTCSCAVYIDDYRYLDRHYCLSETLRPYTTGCLLCAAAINVWGRKNGIDDFIWVIEKGDQDQSDLRRRWEIAYPNETVEPIFVKKRDRYPDPKVCRPIRPLEAADLLAYEHLKVHKLLDSKQGEELFEDELRGPMLRMKNWESLRDWRIIDTKSLLVLCEHFQIPERSTAI
jgi:hypothetical protein